MLLGALLLLASTIALSIGADRAILLNRLDERIDRELTQEVDELRRLAGGVDPDTGQPFGDDVAAVFDTFFDRNVPAEDEVFLALLDAVPYARSAGALHPVEQLPELVGRWATASGVTFRTDDTPSGPLRSLAVPVRTPGGETAGTFVVARFTEPARREVDEAVRVAATVGGAAFLVAAMVAWGIAGRVLRPLRQLAGATEEISEEDLSHRIPVQGSGELATLSNRFNDMLDRVEHAVTAQRDFLDDASHELRTPITVLRGHIELVDPDQPLTASTRDLLLDELDRMGRIVEDLLTMAKAEQPDFVVPAPVDVADLTGEIVDKARPLAERRWQVQAGAVVVARLDRQRIVQAWMNLVRNAVQHTTAGDTITVFSRVNVGALELGVADTGEGVAPADRDRIFERFGRGDSTRRTRSDGAGLGLTIAAAVAGAHGGRIELRDTPGGGATFVLCLPADDDRNTELEEDGWPAS
ncbi:MAG: HAMP domain-containing sensor histidine kinase [Acidimicrobiales bacterium]